MNRVTLSGVLVFGNLLGLTGLWKYSAQQGFSFWYIIQSPTVAILVGVAIAFALSLILSVYYVFASMKYVPAVKIQELRPKDSRKPSWNKKLLLWDNFPLMLAALVLASAFYFQVNDFKYFLLIMLVIFFFASVAFNVFINAPVYKERGSFKYLFSFDLLFFYFFRQLLLFLLILMATIPLVLSLHSMISPHIKDVPFLMRFSSNERFDLNFQIVMLLLVQLITICLINLFLSYVKPKENKQESAFSPYFKAAAVTGNVKKRSLSKWSIFKASWVKSRGEVVEPFKKWPFPVLVTIYVFYFWITDNAADVTYKALLLTNVATEMKSVEEEKQNTWDRVRIENVNDLRYEEKLVIAADWYQVIFRGRGEAIVGVYTCKDTTADDFAACQITKQKLVEIPSNSVLLQTYRVTVTR